MAEAASGVTQRGQDFAMLWPIAEMAQNSQCWIQGGEQGIGYEVSQLVESDTGASSASHLYLHWKSTAPTKSELKPQEATSAYRDPVKHNGIKLNPTSLTSLFIKQAVEVPELLRYTDAYLGWVAKNPAIRRFGTVPSLLIRQCLLLPDNPFLVPDSPLIEQLANQGDLRFTSALTSKIGEFLIKNLEETTTWPRSRPNYKQDLIRIVEVLHEHELVPIKFWQFVRSTPLSRWPEILNIDTTRLATRRLQHYDPR